MNYYIWTMGCQMNKAESSDIENCFKTLKMSRINRINMADVVVLNTCVVRQHAENKVLGMLGYLKGVKKDNPVMRIIVTGCFVHDEMALLKKLFPHIDLFFKPGEIDKLKEWLFSEYVAHPGEINDIQPKNVPVSVYLPIIQGCNNFCSYCIVPYRRGRERSRKLSEILEQAERLVGAGAREIVLVGQNVNAYGKDIEEKPDLSKLLTQLNGIDGLKRIRFLTNHPKDMKSDLIEAIASLNKVCHHLCLPLQSGDDHILYLMNRSYSYSEYKSLIYDIRTVVPDIAISTDVIVGFPGETDGEFFNTYHALKELRFDAVHVASYSTRPGTRASIEFTDDIDESVKRQRLHAIEALQYEILLEINTNLIGKDLEVLVEGKKDHNWFGRTYNDKIVFFPFDGDITGKLVTVRVESATPWALKGTAIEIDN